LAATTTADKMVIPPLPRPVLRNVPESVRRVYNIMANAADDQEERCTLTMAEIGAIAQISRYTVHRAIKRLIAMGFVAVVVQRTGRGRGNTYRVWKYSLPYKLYRKRDKNFSTESVTPPHTPPSIRAHLTRSFDDNSGFYLNSLKTAGRLLRAVRLAVEKARLTELQGKAVLNTIGRMVFHEGRLSEFQQHPEALVEILNLLAGRGFSPPPSDGSPLSRVYAWASFPRFILAKHVAGVVMITERLEMLKDKMSMGTSVSKFSTGRPAKVSHSPKGRSGVDLPARLPRESAPRRRGLALADSIAGDPSGTARGVYRLPPGWGRRRRRRTWDEKGVIPSWAQ